MARPLKSQWEFGELFPAEAVRKVLSVSELTGSIRRILEKGLELHSEDEAEGAGLQMPQHDNIRGEQYYQ